LTILPIKTPESVREKVRGTTIAISETIPPELPPKRKNTPDDHGHFQSNLLSATIYENNQNKGKNLPAPLTPISPKLADNLKDKLESSNTLSPDTRHMSNSNSADLLFSSPIFNYTPFDNTPDDLLNVTDFTGGISNINYDFDLSDYSGENSLAEDIQIENKDFQKDLGDEASLKIDLEEFDPLLKKDFIIKDESCNTYGNEPIEENGAMSLNIDNTLEDSSKNLIESDSPSHILLPSPIKPTTSDYRGFSNFDIPSISCNTGDFSSLNIQNDDETK